VKFKTERLTGNLNVECTEMTAGKRGCRYVNRQVKHCCFQWMFKVSNLVEQLKETFNYIFRCFKLLCTCYAFVGHFLMVQVAYCRS